MNTRLAKYRSAGESLYWAVLLALLMSGSLTRAGAKAISVGDTFPDLASFSLEGDLPTALKGKIVVVDFWASWCAPCKETFPLLEQLHFRFGRQALVIVAVNEDKSRAAMTEFLDDHPVTFTVVRDAKKKLAATVNVPKLPTSYVLDRNGKVLFIESGARVAGNRKAFIERIEKLVRENKDKA